MGIVEIVTNERALVEAMTPLYLAVSECFVGKVDGYSLLHV